MFFSPFFCIKIQNVSKLRGGRVEVRGWGGMRPHLNAKIVTLLRSKVAYLIKITRSGKHSRDRIASRPILHTGRAANTVANPDQYPDALRYQSK